MLLPFRVLILDDIENTVNLAFHQNGYKTDDKPIEMVRSSSEDNSNEEKRQRLIQELIATEEAYVNDLELTISVFKEPLFSKKALTPREVEEVFVNWEQLQAINKKFLKGLKRRKRDSVKSGYSGIDSIGDIIAHNLSKMESAYIMFCSRALAAAKIIQKKTEENGYFVEVVKQCVQGGRTNNMTLSSYLLKPTQRITKYPILVEKIAECTPPGHEDYDNMKTAHDWAKYLCNRINEGTRLHENVGRLEWIQSHVQLEAMEHRVLFNSETNFLGMREVLHVGSLTKVNSGRELVAFLFTDFLLFALPTKEIGKVSNLFMSDRAMSSYYKMYKPPYFLDEIELISQQPAANNGSSCNSSSSASSSPSIDNQMNADPAVFALNRKREKRDKSVALFKAISVNDRTNWVSKLSSAVRVYCDSQKSKVLLTSSKTPTIDPSKSANDQLSI